MAAERRDNLRVNVEIYFNQIVGEQPYRSVATSLSASGLSLSHLPDPFGGLSRDTRLVQIDLPLPGTTDSIWATAQIVRDTVDAYFHDCGVRLVTMARAHARLLDDYVEHVRLHDLRRRVREMRSRLQNQPPATIRPQVRHARPPAIAARVEPHSAHRAARELSVRSGAGRAPGSLTEPI